VIVRRRCLRPRRVGAEVGFELGVPPLALVCSVLAANELDVGASLVGGQVAGGQANVRGDPWVRAERGWVVGLGGHAASRSIRVAVSG
jgi:hypothetical protein